MKLNTPDKIIRDCLLKNFLPQIVARLGYRYLGKFSFDNNVLFIWPIALFRPIGVHYSYHTVELCRRIATYDLTDYIK